MKKFIIILCIIFLVSGCSMLNNVNAQGNESLYYTKQIRSIEYLGEYMNQRIASKKPMKIKLVGDSITAGYGVAGYSIPDNNPIIFTDTDGTVYKEAIYNTKSFANYFRSYILTLNPNNEFYNWGIGNKSAVWWNSKKQNFTSEDIVFVMLGTNDREFSTSLADFKTQLTSLLLHLRSVSNYVVVMSANPISVLAESPSYKFSQSDANRTIKEICLENNFPLISHYDEFLKFSETEGQFTSLLADTIHPNESGYQIIWENIQKSLSIYDVKYYETKTSTQSNVTPDNFNNFAKMYSQGSRAIVSNLQKNPLMDEWTDNIPTGATATNVSVQKIPSIYKGQYAAKLNPTAPNGFFTFPASLPTNREKCKLIIAYESVGVTRMHVMQGANVNLRVDETLPQGKHIREFTFDFEPGFLDVFYVRLYPNITRLTEGYLIVDSIVCVKDSQYQFGYFSDEPKKQIIMESPNGTKYILKVNDDGTITTTLYTQ